MAPHSCDACVTVWQLSTSFSIGLQTPEQTANSKSRKLSDHPLCELGPLDTDSTSIGTQVEGV